LLTVLNEQQDTTWRDWHERCKGPGITVRLFSSTRISRMIAMSIVALGFASGAMRAADTSNSIEAKNTAATVAAKERARKASPAELRKLFEEVNKQRDTMIADFEALAKQMKDASEEKKKEIREKLEQQKKNFEEVSNALMRQIRDEQRKQRQSAVPGKR
jgi:Skp family chaperone for outer membrane proteins